MPEETNREEFPSNSHSKKIMRSEPPKKLQKVVTGTIKKKKKSFADSFTETFFGDSARSVGNYILLDVLIPAAKNTIADMITNGIEMLLYGEPRRSRRDRDRNRGYVSYGSFYDRDRERDRERSRDRERHETRSRPAHNFDEIIFDRYSDAEEVLSNMLETIDRYDVVTIADFYDLLGIADEWTDNKWGWETLSKAAIVPVRGGGYILDLPKPIYIERG